MSTCCAKTHFQDWYVAPCGQMAAVVNDPDLPLCYYHQQVAAQRLEPVVDCSDLDDARKNPPVSVDARGVNLWTNPAAMGVVNTNQSTKE